MTVRISGKLGLKGSSGLNFRNVYGFLPSMLFAKGEQGVWYDPSDFSTMFQDAAGTTPVTAVEQPVGRILDKSGRGNHATQSTLGNRPVLSARYNLLTKTEQFDDAVWTTANRLTVSANTTETTDPIGGNTAEKIIETTDNGSHRVLQGNIPYVNATYTLSCYFKKGTRQWVWLSAAGAIVDHSTRLIQWYDLDNIVAGTMTVVQTGGSVDMIDFVSASITDQGNGWRRCMLSYTLKNSPIITFSDVVIGLASADGNNIYAGTIGDYGYIWGADLRVANDGVGLPVYQRVNTSTDYDTVGFPPYLRFDGTDDFLVTGTINPGAVDKAQVFAGVRKLSDAAIAVVAEWSAAWFSNAGTFAVTAPNTTGTSDYRFASKGSGFFTGGQAISPATFVAPITNVLTGIGDISADVSTLRLNGSQVAQATADQGTGNYLSYPLFIGRRGGTTQPFNGRLYGLIVRFSSTNLSAIEIDATEKWVNSKTKAY